MKYMGKTDVFYFDNCDFMDKIITQNLNKNDVTMNLLSFLGYMLQGLYMI